VRIPLSRRFFLVDRRYLSLLREIAFAETKSQDQSTILGFLWSFLHPLLVLLFLYVLFKQRAGRNIPHYSIFLLIGLIHYTHFSTTTSYAMRVLYQMRSLAANVIFPKELLVFGSILSHAPELIISMLIAVVIAILTGVPAAPVLLTLPLVIALQLLFSLWVSLFLSWVFVFVHDFDHVYSVVLRVLLVVTPIFYGLDFVSQRYRGLLQLNPLAILIDFSRDIVLNQTFPALSTISLFLVADVTLAIAALTVFRRMEVDMIERL
jgi:ABC-type polysaccharide/polyol phosphate export permease